MTTTIQEEKYKELSFTNVSSILLPFGQATGNAMST